MSRETFKLLCIMQYLQIYSLKRLILSKHMYFAKHEQHKCSWKKRPQRCDLRQLFWRASTPQVLLRRILYFDADASGESFVKCSSDPREKSHLPCRPNSQLHRRPPLRSLSCPPGPSCRPHRPPYPSSWYHPLPCLYLHRLPPCLLTPP